MMEKGSKIDVATTQKGSIIRVDNLKEIEEGNNLLSERKEIIKDLIRLEKQRPKSKKGHDIWLQDKDTQHKKLDAIEREIDAFTKTNRIYFDKDQALLL